MLSFISSFLYIYGGLLGLVFLVYIVSLKYPLQEQTAAFELVTVSAGGKENRFISATLSAVLFVSMISVGLVLIWLALKIWGNAFQVFFVILGLLISGTFVASLNLERYSMWLRGHSVIRMGIKIALILVIGLGWIFAPSWITYDILGVAAGIGLLRTIKPGRMSYVLIGVGALIAYDVVAVFGTPLMEDVVSGMGNFVPPMVIVIPFNLLDLSPNFMAILGLGDIALPGYAVITASKYKLERFAMVGYAIGLLLALLLSSVLSRGVPALLTLGPCVMGAILLGALLKRTRIEW